MDNAETPATTGGDRALRFVFEDTDIRGEVVHMHESFSDILAIHQYAPGVSRLLGEFLAAAVLLSTTLKFEGKLILQVSSEGEVPLLMVECSSNREVRAIARGAEQATSKQFDTLLAGGQLAITIDPASGQRYQGIVPLAGGSLAASIDAYFEQSEQLPTRLWLASGEQSAAGMLLQQLPARAATVPEERAEHWAHACALAGTLGAEELLALKAESLLHRLFHEDPLRVFPAQPVCFACNCSRERTYNALATLDPAEIADILEEQGSVTMDCEFCNQQYVFQKGDLSELVAGEQPRTLH